MRIFVTPYCIVLMWPLSLGDLQQSSVSATSESKSRITPQPLPSASNVMASNSLVFDSQATQGQEHHPSPPAGPATQPSGSEHASQRGGGVLGTTHQECGDEHIVLRSEMSDWQHRALRLAPQLPRNTMMQH